MYVLHNKVSFYVEVFLAPRLIPKLEDHLVSAVRNCLFNMFAASLHIGGLFLLPQPEDTPCRGNGVSHIMEYSSLGRRKTKYKGSSKKMDGI